MENGENWRTILVFSQKDWDQKLEAHLFFAWLTPVCVFDYRMTE